MLPATIDVTFLSHNRNQLILMHLEALAAAGYGGTTHHGVWAGYKAPHSAQDMLLGYGEGLVPLRANGLPFLINRNGDLAMSFSLLLLFSSAMITAVVGKYTFIHSNMANVACLSLLILFGIAMWVQGLRKPVV